MTKTRGCKRSKDRFPSTNFQNQQNMLNNNNLSPVIVPSSRKRQQKVRVKRVSWRDEQIQSMSVGEIDPAILFVRERVTIRYSKEELLEISKNPASKGKPDFFDPNEVSVSILDPDKWNLERKKSDNPDTGSKGSDNGDNRRRPGDPRERIRKENDGIVLSPQRRSFNSGCFVPANKEPLGGKGDAPPPHLMGVREISSSTRRIGSGRILRDSWDPEKESGEPEFGSGGFGSGRGGQQSTRSNEEQGRNIRGVGDDKFERRSFGRDLDGKEGSTSSSRRSSRYSESRRRFSESKEDEPEWFSSGPISQNETIELRGFDEHENSRTKKRTARNIKRAIEFNKKKEMVIVEDKEKDESEPKDRSTPNQTEPGTSKNEKEEEPNNDVVKEAAQKDVGQKSAQNAPRNENTFDFDEFLKGENIPGLLSNGVVDESDKSTSRFSRWFKKDSPNREMTESSRRSSIQDDNHIIKDLLKDINESSSIPVTIQPPIDSNTYFAPISPAGNTPGEGLESLIGGEKTHMGQQSVNFMKMISRGKQPQHQQASEGWNMKGAQKPPPMAGGKILSLDELEAKMRQQNSDHSPNAPQKVSPQKPDEEMTAAFKRLLQQAGGHTAPLNGPMNKPPAMSLLEMLNHSQQQDEARFAAAQAAAASQQHHQLFSALHAQQPQPPQIHNDLTMKLQQAQLQQKQMDMFGKLMSAGGVPVAPQMRASPLLDLGAQQSRELLSRPEAQAILQAMHQRIPSPRELQVHTQGILQRALIKKKLEEQTENFRKKQEMQRGTSPHPVLGMSAPPSSAAALSSGPAPSSGNLQGGGKSLSSPTPLAFAPTSVLRKMTADKDEGKENKAVTDNGLKPQGRPLTAMRQPQPQHPINSQQWNPAFPLKQAGRPIVKANNYQSQTPDQFFAQLAAQQQPLPQQRTYQPVPVAPHRKPIVGQQQYPLAQQPQAPVQPGSQYGPSQPPQYPTHPNPPQQSFPQPTAQQLRAQHQHRPNNNQNLGALSQVTQNQQSQGQQQPQQANLQQSSQKPPQGTPQQSIGFPHPQQQGTAAWQQFLNSTPQQNSRPVGAHSRPIQQQSGGPLSPTTADQLTRWFSPDLLERARGGELPSTANLARLEEIERQAAPPVHN